MKTPHPIPYQGSKRLLAPIILNYFPKDATALFEPFAGAAAVSLAAIRKGKVSRVVLNDINAPLMRLWEEIIERPGIIASAYAKLWETQLGREREYYDIVRDKFNQTGKPHYLLYLLARCVKASVRYNSNGQFNQSPDNRRRGMNPNTMRWHILAAAQLLKRRTTVSTEDYRDSLKAASREDMVYMDPPYQGVCANRDPRYIGGLDFNRFIATLRDLNERQISYILSYDGRTGNKVYGKPMPRELSLWHIEIEAGRSSQATLLGRNSSTYESLYLSPALIARIGLVNAESLTIPPKQFTLLAQNAT